MKITVNLAHKSYDIFIEKDILQNIGAYLDLTNRKILIISDEGVPTYYRDTVYRQCANAFLYVIPSGETSKSLSTHQKIMEFMLENKFTRKDLVIALGGGVVGDLSGFVASTYMRGISYISIPTTTLSQIDSSIGGKTGVNLGKVKNIVGSFYHPDFVFVDINTLKTLTKRQYHSGLIEALKAGLIYDKELFELFENYEENLEQIIYKSLLVKKDVVEKDEKEQNLRKILNFGHTLGHGIESFYDFSYLHGECVAFGMIPMIKDLELRNNVIKILSKMGIDTNITYDFDKVFEIVKLDKKSNGDSITIVMVSSVGSFELIDISIDKLYLLMKGQ